MKTQTIDQEPKLAAPGAGIPTVERWVAGVMLRLGDRWSTPTAVADRFLRARQEVLGRVDRCGAGVAATRVLIPRLQGLEDSSRYWSVFMTVHHLAIVNRAVAGIVDSLRADQIPPRQANTADVKPDPAAGPGVVEEFDESCRDVQRAASGSAEALRTRLRFAHPWFGPLDASQWHYLAAFHMNLHLRQIDRILEFAARA